MRGMSPLANAGGRCYWGGNPDATVQKVRVVTGLPRRGPGELHSGEEVALPIEQEGANKFCLHGQVTLLLQPSRRQLVIRVCVPPGGLRVQVHLDAM